MVAVDLRHTDPGLFRLLQHGPLLLVAEETPVRWPVRRFVRLRRGPRVKSFWANS
jgi:hypothetical protein